MLKFEKIRRQKVKWHGDKFFHLELPSSVVVIPLKLCTHIPFIYHRRYTILATDNVIKQHSALLCLLSLSLNVYSSGYEREIIQAYIQKIESTSSLRMTNGKQMEPFKKKPEANIFFSVWIIQTTKRTERESTAIFIQLVTMVTTTLPHICLPYSSNHSYGSDSKGHRTV